MTDDRLHRLEERGLTRELGFGERPAVLAVDLVNAFTDPKLPFGADLDAWLEAFALLWDDEDAYAGHASRAELNGRRADAAAVEAADRFETLLRQSTSASA